MDIIDIIKIILIIPAMIAGTIVGISIGGVLTKEGIDPYDLGKIRVLFCWLFVCAYLVLLCMTLDFNYTTMTRYVWFNINTGEFGGSFVLLDHIMSEEEFISLVTNSPTLTEGYKLIKFECLNDKDFVFTDRMRIIDKVTPIK